MTFLTAFLGLAILLVAGDLLVRGAVNAALRLGVSALIISLTVVAFGTSAPELLIAVDAAISGVPGIALGNVVGSNTANVLLVLGIPALIAGLATGDCETRGSYVTMIAVSLLFIGVCFLGPLMWMHGLVLLAALSVILFGQFREARAHRADLKAAAGPAEVEAADPGMPWWRISVFLVLGLVGLPLGADLLVDGARDIALRVGVSDTVIGLTLVAVGTSLPELATTVAAAIRNQADVALGNVIGSNMFNLLAIIGLAVLVAPIEVDPVFLRLDLWVMLASSLLVAPFAIGRGLHLNRGWGAAFCALYAVYMWVLVS